VGDRINTLVRKPGAGDLHARFDERDLETGHFGVTAPDLDSTCAVERAPDPVGGNLPGRSCSTWKQSEREGLATVQHEAFDAKGPARPDQRALRP